MERQLILTIVGPSPRELEPLDAHAMPPFHIGRDPVCNLVLADGLVSRQHCRIYRENGRVWIEDQKSKDGTLVNRQRLTAPTALRNGDEISIGDTVIRVTLPPRKTPASPVAMKPDDATIARPSEDLPYEATIVASTRVFEPAANTAAIALKEDGFFIGRDPACGCRVNSPMISWHHACVKREADHWMLEDLGSSNGSFVNGMRLAKPRKLARGDVLSFGPFRFTFNDNALTPRASAGGIRIAARGLSKVVKNRQTGQPLTLLNHIELTIEPREFVVLLGQSGCGKSTFMDTLNGRRPASQGAVIYDGQDLYKHFDSLKSAIGYVPQEVIFHDGLPLADTLRYSAHLRLPEDTSPEEIEANIDRVLKTVGLSERRGTRIRDLSGGQRKRVSIAIELLSAPQVLFLDEVTSGLDPGTEQQMMQLFRTLADDGMTIVCVTHHLDSLHVTDAVAYFFKGRLAFFGPPQMLPEHFEIAEIREIYEVEADASPEAWENRFKSSKLHNIYVKLRSQRDPTPGLAADSQTPPPPSRATLRGHFFRQWRVLSARYTKLLRMEFRNVLLLLGLAPAVAIMLCISANSINVVDHPATLEQFHQAGIKQNLLCFGSSIIILFLALFGSVREIVKEIHIYKHERFINLQLFPYFLSKALPLIAIGILQVLMVTAVLHLSGGMHAGSFAFDVLILSLVSIVGTLMGLAISAAAASSDWAIICMIAIVIPEIIFSGALVPASGFSGIISKGFICVYWALRALLGQLDDGTRAAIPGTPPTGQAFNSILVLSLHSLVMALATVLFLLAKDSHGPIARLFAFFRGLIVRKRAIKEQLL